MIILISLNQRSTSGIKSCFLSEKFESEKMKSFVSFLSLTFAQNLAEKWESFQNSRSSAGMVENMLKFYVENSGFSGSVDVSEVLASGCWCHLDHVNKVGFPGNSENIS